MSNPHLLLTLKTNTMIKLTFEGYRNGTDFDSITIECKESDKQMWLDYYWDWKHVRDVV